GRGDAAEAVALPAVGLAEALAEMEVHAPDEGGDAEDEEEEPPVLDGHEHGAAEHLPDLDEGDEKHVLHADADVLGVAREAADEASHGLAVEVAHRQPEPVAEHGGAQVVDDGLAHLKGPF